MDKELEKKYKPMQANVTVDMKLLFREQKTEEKKEEVVSEKCYFDIKGECIDVFVSGARVNAGAYTAKYVQTGSNIKIYNTHTPLDAGEYWITASSDNKMEMSVLNGTTEVRLYLTRLSL